MLIAGCHETSPYLREVLPAYDQHGKRLEGYYTLPEPYMRHMLQDLKACYRETQ